MANRLKPVVYSFWLFLLFACQAPPAQNENLKSEMPKMGIHLLLDDGRNQWSTDLWAKHMATLAETMPNGGYVTQLVRLDDLDAEKWQIFVDLCLEHQFIPIIRLATTFDQQANWWVAPTVDSDGSYTSIAQQYVTFLAQLDWQNLPRLIVVGNEPNHGNEWGGVPNPAEYARFLGDVVGALHKWDAGVVVLNAGMDPFTPHTNQQPFLDGMAYMDSESFLQGMFDADPTIFQQIDAWASHPYPLGPFSAPPDQQTFYIDYLNGAINPKHIEPPTGIYNRGIQGYEWELWWLEQHGITDLPVYITETGWRFSDTLPPAQVAQYLDQAWQTWQKDERIQAITFFAFNGNPAEWGEHTNWLLLNEEGQVLGERQPLKWLETITP